MNVFMERAIYGSLLWGPLLRPLQAFMNTIEAWHERRETRLEIERLSSREMRDIGVHPADLAEEWRGQRWY